MRKITNTIAITILLLVAAGAALLLRAGGMEPAPTPTPLPVLTAPPALTPLPTPSPTPEPTSTPTPTPECFTLSFVGDCTLASSQHHKGASFAFEAFVGEDYSYPFARTRQYLENDYLSIANLESTFTVSESSNGATFTFRADPAYAQILPEGSIEFVTLANNHADDYLAQGREDTRAALEAVGVAYGGNGEGSIYQKDNGPAIGVYCTLYPELDSPEKVTAGVRALKDAGAELVIVAAHWGLEGSYQVTPGQQTIGRAAIDAGADIVYGSHPHVLQRAEAYGGGQILYSMGNWSFGGNTAPRDRDTAIAQITVERAADGTFSIGAPEFIPCKLSGTDAFNDYQPQPYEAGTAEYDRAMSKLDGSFTGPDLSIDYSAFH